MEKARGFTLIEILMVMAILSILFAMLLASTQAIQSAQRRGATSRALAAADQALVNFVMVTRRLPCPADGALAPADPLAGAEMRVGQACTGAQARGVVPWRALGITEAEITDGYEGRITYRVEASLVADDTLLLVACDPAGDGAAVVGQPGRCGACPDLGAGVPAVCTRPREAVRDRGLMVKDAVAGVVLADPAADPPTGAAFVLVSHGENRAGAYTAQGALQAGTGSVGDGEAQNTAVDAVKAFYVDSGINGTATNAHFDDVIARQTVTGLVQRAGVGPRIHRPPGS